MIEITEQKAKEITKGFAIPPQPEILKKIQIETQQEYPNIDRISDLIATDVGLSAYLLKTINSPAYGLNRTVSDVKQGAMFLGLKALYSIISFYELKSAFKGTKSSISLERFWDSSAESAKLCSLAVKHLNLSSNCPVEYAYTLGLFHDCGIPAMAIKFPDYRQTLEAINKKSGIPFTDTEESVYRTNHAVVGYFVLTSWNMPAFICEFVGRHHDPTLFFSDKSDPMHKDLFGLMKLVDNALARHRRGNDDTEWSLYKEAVLAHFGMSEEDHVEFEGDLIDDFLVN
jgi:HD-like signal output (HDOD) protein